jgi:thiol-disulfide isomerase/thioredoxin
MKHFFLLLTLLISTHLEAQEVPFIHRDQIERWKNTESDTVFVLNFWATWCAPCVAELPAFEKLNQLYAAEKVQVVLVSNDFRRQVETTLKPFILDRGLKSQVVFMDESNANNWINLVSPDWSGAIPSTLIISKRKNKVLLFEEQMTYTELEEALLSVL